jgi:hypothetical protein
MVAGRINPDWLIAAKSNTLSMREIVDWFRTATNVSDVCFGDGGEVWVGNRWLDQDAIDELCARIDAGV